MEIKLINGRFSIQEAERLLTSIVKVKIAFHEDKIRTIHQTEEDIKHSEKRIIQLQNSLSDAIKKLREQGKENTYVNALIEVNFTPPLN